MAELARRSAGSAPSGRHVFLSHSVPYPGDRGRPLVEHNRALFATLKGDLVQAIDLYCSEPLFSAHRKGYIAPPTLTDDEVRAYLEEAIHGHDVREWFPTHEMMFDSRRIHYGGSGDAHPVSNWIGGARWSDEESDARIESLLAKYRRAGSGFQWWVLPFDTPADMGQRLERHGLMFAGQVARMARLGLDDLSDIAENRDVVVEALDGADDAASEDALQVMGVGFHMTSEQIGQERSTWHERLRDPEMRQKEVRCLARLEGKPIGMGSVFFRAGRAYLGGAATLPEYRGRKVYSTLLKRRLAAAHERGYHLAAIDAGPMSRRVVERHGFKDYGTVYVYGWMPEMDPEVIKSLVPDE